ncbi:helix-turn-helix transcriptional regulator [filamentous cyanobacterium LEGE 11480]|uniref:Helix-turn-helix transcriptional regulator n=1 Tax=Romeriopsis navalis LEGE 11480 TaxID=2777977 RepID=A0A928VSQ6_9CYAN|nr:helix-turn-helix transcriptional regulator [Romeriopsis navalis]MBE9031404.1 helix-turn-helix transcriptional regulator [Romeriopsis navalis LEGE 11480]
MARAGKALKRVLTRYGISQNQLATTMGIDRSNVSRWVSESRDPSAEAVAQIKQALVHLQPPAAEDFVQFYLYEGMEEAKTIPATPTSEHGTNIGIQPSSQVTTPTTLTPVPSRHPGFVM